MRVHGFFASTPGLDGGPNEPAASGHNVGGLCEAVNAPLYDGNHSFACGTEPQVRIPLCRFAITNAEGFETGSFK